ncbi:MAG: hypothetical protein ABI197_05270 [Granulicella sp.]
MTINLQANRTLIINNWNIGFKKIEFTKMLRSELGLGLSEAKEITDSVLDRKSVELQVSDENYGHMIELATELGAVVAGKEMESSCR